MLRALDTETTGLHLLHTDRPFFLSITSENTEVTHWHFRVDPKTRIPIVPLKDKQRITKEVMDPKTRWVCHNTKFDTRALCHLTTEDFDPLVFIGRCEDTLLMSHVLNSLESHGLKDLALKYCNIPDDDQQYLKQTAIEARRMADSLGWKIANKETMPLLHKAPNGGYWVCDMWVPAEIYLHMKQVVKDQDWCERHSDWLEACSVYGNQDTLRTICLAVSMLATLEERGVLEQYKEQLELLAITYKMELNGVSIKMPLIESELIRLEEKAEAYAKEAAKVTGFPDMNINSPKQVGHILYNHFKLPVTRQTNAGNPSADQKVYEHILRKEPEDSTLYQFAFNVLLSKKCKTCTTYLKSYKRLSRQNKTGWCLHPNYNLTGTHTTRLSSNDPNGTNVGKGEDPFVEEVKEANLSLRRIFGPNKGREWFAVDYKQLQLFIFACVSGETDMRDKMLAGHDAHTITGRTVFDLPETIIPDSGQRRVAKACNFGFVFGAGEYKLEETAKISGLYDILRERMPNAVSFIAHCTKMAKKEGKVWAAGYPLIVPPEKPYAASCYVIQGWEGKIVKRGMIYCDAYLSENCPLAFITLNVHDELVFDFPLGQGDYHIAELCYLMERAGAELDVPCQVDAKYIVDSWDKGISVEFK